MSRLLNDLSNLASNNNQGIAHYNLALSSMNQKNYTSAISSFLKALEVDKSEQMKSTVLPNLGLAYLMNKDYEKAIDKLVLALLVKNTNDGLAFIHANLGYAYSEIKYYGLAMREYKLSLEYRPDDAKIHYSLAMLYDSKFQNDLAYAEMEKALTIDPNNETYIDTYNSLENTPLLSLQVGRLTRALLTLGIIVVPSYHIEMNMHLPMIAFIYPQSPLKALARPGDFITAVDNEIPSEGFIDRLDVEPNTKVSLKINKSTTVINSIEKIVTKLDLESRMKLYQNWFHSFDQKIVNIWGLDGDSQKCKDYGAKLGYEYESLIRSWSAYRDQDKLFDSAFSLLMEFFQAYTYTGSEDVNYEINLSNLKFDIVNVSIVNFFRDSGLKESAAYLNNKAGNAQT